MPNLSSQDQSTEFLLYTASNGAVKVEVLLNGETLWLIQERMEKLLSNKGAGEDRENKP